MARTSFPTWIKIFFPLVHLIFLILWVWHLVSYNHTFSKPENWSTFDLSYNETQVGSIASSYYYKPSLFVGVSFIGAFGSTVLLGVTWLIFVSKGDCFAVFMASFGTFISGFIILNMLLSTSTTTYPREDMTPPWRYSPDGFLRLDYSTSSKGRRNDDGHILQVECPDHSTHSTETYGRIFTAEPVPNPPTFTPQPLCAYYYSSLQGKLFELCCALRDNAVSSPLFRNEGQEVFHGLLIGYFGFLIVWYFSVIIYAKSKKQRILPLSDIQVRENEDTTEPL